MVPNNHPSAGYDGMIPVFKKPHHKPELTSALLELGKNEMLQTQTYRHTNTTTGFDTNIFFNVIR